MNYQNPDRISVEQTCVADVFPRCAIMDVVIEGESSAFGDEAFKKSKEVAQFLSDLAALNYSSRHVSLQNMAIQTSSGKLLKSSQAKFNLRLGEIELDLVPNILGIVALQKNIEIQGLDYDFGDLNEAKTALLMQACSLAKQQGIQIAQAFGVSLLSVYSMSQAWSYPNNQALTQSHAAGGFVKSRVLNRQDLGIEGLEFVANQKGQLSLLLSVQFRVSGF